MPSVVTAVWSCIRPGSHRPRPQGAALTVGDGGGLDRVLLALAGHKRPPAGPVGPGPADLGLGAVAAQLDPVGGGQQPRSPTTPYQQLVRQVRQALRLGLLREGDQLPTVKDVVAQLAINPNTVLKAYRELEHEGLVAARPGVGTFVTATLADASLAAHGPLRQELRRWLARARRAGLDEESIEALFMTTFRAAAQEDIA